MHCIQVYVEVGRVALVTQKRYKNTLAVIVNVVDQRRAMCDIFDAHSEKARLIARASIQFKTLRLTRLKVEGILWNSHSKFVIEKYNACDVQGQFHATRFYRSWMDKKKVGFFSCLRGPYNYLISSFLCQPIQF